MKLRVSATLLVGLAPSGSPAAVDAALAIGGLAVVDDRFVPGRPG